MLNMQLLSFKLNQHTVVITLSLLVCISLYYPKRLITSVLNDVKNRLMLTLNKNEVHCALTQ